MKTRNKIITILLIAAIAASIIAFAPILPVKAEVISGSTEISPEMQHIITMGNYSLNFALSNFEAEYEGLNVTAESFTVTANTQTINNVTTGYLIIDLQNVHAEITQYEKPIILNVGKAALTVNLHLEGGYMEYSFYADTTSSIYEIAKNAFENFT
jgi:hypothetical protein